VTGALDRQRQLTLGVRRTVGLPSRENLATLVDRETQTGDVFVVDDFVVREDRLLAPGRSTTAATAASTAESTATTTLAALTSRARAKARRPLAVTTAGRASTVSGRTIAAFAAASSVRSLGIQIVIHRWSNAPE
jgi:hypothetical protein